MSSLSDELPPVVRDAKGWGELIGYLVDMNRHIANPGVNALDKRDGLIATVNNLLIMNCDILVAMRPQQAGQKAKIGAVFYFPLAVGGWNDAKHGCG
jgi:hypothetical protein